MELFAKAHQAEASHRTDVMLALSTTHKEKRRCGLKPQRHSLKKKENDLHFPHFPHFNTIRT